MLRCTAPAVLDRLGVQDEREAPDQELQGALLSIVVDDRLGRVTRIPTLYFGSAPVFADREIGRVGHRLRRMIDAIEEYKNRSIYSITGCEFEGRRGLYARDLFNRSAFRMRAQRLGLSFAADPYIELTGASSVANSDWGEFEPNFLLYTPELSRDGELTTKKGALLTWILSVYRLALPPPAELGVLTKLISHMHAVGGGGPRDAIETLRKSLTG